MRDKVRTSGGPTPEQAVLRALNAAEGMAGEYQGWAVDDLQALWQAYQDSAAGSGNVSKMFDIAHEVRGQGGSFGFPLISRIGDSLCKFLETRTSLAAGDLEIIKIHILAMKAVFQQGLKGKQASLDGELTHLLAALRDKVGD
ncbi:MAG: Hpt domain-containing protein [Rhodospirillales bacterium]|nr:Hpt domain-containing protein [Rhodospirillales bacterium]